MISDELWQTICAYMQEYYGYTPTAELRGVLPKIAEIHVFDGGAFVAIGNEFDLFVVPAKRGRWRIRSEISNYLRRMGDRYGKLIVKINERNSASLRLAKFFGFNEIGRDNGVIRLESTSWAT